MIRLGHGIDAQMTATVVWFSTTSSYLHCSGVPNRNLMLPALWMINVSLNSYNPNPTPQTIYTTLTRIILVLILYIYNHVVELVLNLALTLL